MGELAGRVAIVTGASKGIGAAIAKTFATAGAAVAVNYFSNKADADRVVGEIVKAEGKAIAIQADVAKRADVKRLFAETIEKLGRPGVLVNTAGVYSFAPLEDVTEEDFHRQFNTNVQPTGSSPRRTGPRAGMRGSRSPFPRRPPKKAEGRQFVHFRGPPSKSLRS